MAYVKVDIGDLQDARAQIRETFRQQDAIVDKIRGEVTRRAARPRKTRRIFAVDSGFNTAYETTFTIVKAAVVDEALTVDLREDVFLFHVDNYQTDRLRRLLMQQALYEALAQTVRSGRADGSLVLVDGTLALTVFYPTRKDRKEYRRHFRAFYEELYTPLMARCVEHDILVLGFLKRTGSTYLAEYLNVRGTYDIYLVHALLPDEGHYVGPIPVIDSGAKQAKVHHHYVTFYLNLKRWVYRFELLKAQEQIYAEGIENLLDVATEAHYGMNPIFSKADEYARVSKREADLKFDYVIHDLDAEDRTRLRLEARKRTHFGYSTTRLPGRGTLR